MSKRAVFPLLVTVSILAPGPAAAQRPVEVAFAGPQPHFVAAWAPNKAREAERSAVLGRRLSLQLADVSLDAALKELTNQAGLHITYSPSILPAGKRVTIKASDIAVVTALTEILFQSGLDVVVDRDGTLALVPCRHPAPRAEIQDSGTIVGTVTDKATGAPIAGATVLVEGTRRSATTNNDGRYRIGGIEAGTYTVRARYIGYAVLTTSVTLSAGEEATADFGLEKSAQRLEDVVTTGTFIPTEVRALPTPVSVITEEELARQRQTTVQKLFRQAVPTAVGWDDAAYPGVTAFSVRGASTLTTGSGQMKVLIDGIEAANATDAAVDPASIERIEVIRGPQAAAIYGSDAIGGVVQIFTKRGDPNLPRPQMNAEAALGVIQTGYAGIGGVMRQSYRGSIRGGGSDVSYNVGAGYSHTGDYLPNGEISAQSNPSVYGGMHFARGIIAVDMSGRYHVQNTPNVFNPALLQTGFSFYSKPFYQPAQYKNETIGARVSVAAAKWWQHVVNVGIDRYDLDLVQRQPRLTTASDTLLEVLNQATTRTSVGYSMSIQGSLGPRMSGSLTAGFDHYTLPSTLWYTFGAVSTTGTIQIAPGQSFTVSSTRTSNTGYFAQAQLGFRDALFLTGGLRAEQNSNFGDSLGTPVSPRVGLSYVQSLGRATVKLRGSLGRAIRPPSPGQKFAGMTPTGVVLANSRLAPERQNGWDAGIDAVFGAGGLLSITYYNQTAGNLIQIVQLEAGPPPTSQSQNVGRVDNTGVEVEGTLSLGPLQLKGQYGYTRARVSRLAPGYTGDLRLGDQTLLTPKHTAGGSLTVSPYTGTSVTAGLTYVGSWTHYDFLARFRCFGGTESCRAAPRDYYIAYPALVKVNTTVSQEINSLLSAFVSVDNLTNNQAHEFYNVDPVMGRITTVGLRVRY